MRILEQTESGEVIIIWSPPTSHPDMSEGGDGDGEKRSINPVEGWNKAWERVESEMKAVKEREKADPQGRARISRKSFFY